MARLMERAEEQPGNGMKEQLKHLLKKNPALYSFIEIGYIIEKIYNYKFFLGER